MKSEKTMWGVLLHLGTNMWNDCPDERKGDNPTKCYGRLRMDFDEDVWNDAVERMRAGGLNTLLLDLGEGVVYPSHPELAVKGSWTPERLKKEIARLGEMGIEVIPKLNFSACHDTWLGEYSRMIATEPYYKACSEIIGDVFEIFGKPRYVHLGYDEETAHMQEKFLYTCVRQGELWWHDFLFFVGEVEKRGARAWIWSDYMWAHEKEFLERCPKSVLQSNWYYGRRWEGQKPERENGLTRLLAFDALEKAGFDQMPTGSNWIPKHYGKGANNDQNFTRLVEHCREHVAPERLKGFLNTPWAHTVKRGRKRILDSIDQVAAEIRRANGPKHWYKGNLHTHTLISDGCAFPVEAALLYRDCGYNFLMFSDHDLVHDTELWVNEKNHRRHAFAQQDAERFAAHYPAFAPQTKIDENGVKTWRIGKFNETAAQVNVPGRFIVMSGCEYNDAISGGLQLHCQSINSRHAYTCKRQKTLAESYESMRGHFDKVTANEDAIFAVNHPNWWLYDVDPLLLADKDDLRFFEVANSPGSPDAAFKVEGAYDEDKLWDFALARRCRRGAQLLYGLATDDVHSYGAYYDEIAGKPGRRRGWVTVRCEELSERAIVAALRRGEFYASSGVELEDMAFEGGRLSLKAKGNADDMVIRFYGTKKNANLDDYDPGKPEKIEDLAKRVGRNNKVPGYLGTERRIARLPADVGIVLKETKGLEAAYELQADDMYVRAKVINVKNGDIAWTQPFRAR